MEADQLFSKLEFTSDIQTNYNRFVSSILRAAEKTIPQSKPYKGHKATVPRKPWWDDECDRVRRANIEAFKQFKNSPTLSNFINSKRCTALCRKTYKAKKQTKWVEFCNSFNSQTTIKQVWDGVRALSRGHIPSPQTDGKWIPDFLDSLTPEIVPEIVPEISYVPIK